MASVKGKHTRPELIVRKYLHRRGLRFRLHDRSLPGKPDLVFPKFRAVVQVHGCYWHRHVGCRYATTPSTNTEFWREKLDRNVGRDKRNEFALRELGWNVFVVWECETRSLGRLDSLCDAITHLSHSDRRPRRFPSRHKVDRDRSL